MFYGQILKKDTLTSSFTHPYLIYEGRNENQWENVLPDPGLPSSGWKGMVHSYEKSGMGTETMKSRKTYVLLYTP